MSPDSPQPAVRPPHPLALELIGRLQARPGAAVLEIGSGSGRNTGALEAAGFRVVGLEGERLAAAALTTHALLHGTPASIGGMLERIAARLETSAPLFATFGSVRDARFGRGVRLEEGVYAAQDGDEAGVAHAFFSEPALRRLLEGRWTLESLAEVRVDSIAGSWAHAQQPLRDAVHWFAIARKR